jgi:hypothetical protein
VGVGRAGVGVSGSGSVAGGVGKFSSGAVVAVGSAGKGSGVSLLHPALKINRDRRNIDTITSLRNFGLIGKIILATLLLITFRSF